MVDKKINFLDADDARVTQRSSGMGERGSEITNILYGIDHNAVRTPAPQMDDTYGLTFITRPCLNLSYNNLVRNRTFIRYLTENELSVQRYIRAVLDPLGNRDVNAVACDAKLPFIALLSNRCISMSGWPDKSLNYGVSEAGRFNEVTTFPDHLGGTANVFDLSTTFANVRNNVVGGMLDLWLDYIKAVQNGPLEMRRSMRRARLWEHQTRIYRWVLDRSKNQIVQWGACGVAEPQAYAYGAALNLDTTSPTIEGLNQISTSFKCTGYTYGDPVLIWEFNRLVQMFNPDMRDNHRQQFMVKIPAELSQAFGHRGYPQINAQNEMEWWVDKDTYQYILDGGL